MNLAQKLAACAAIVCIAIGCPPLPGPAPAPPVDSGDASPDDVDGARRPSGKGCDAGCAQLAALGCPEAAPDAGCLDTCERAQFAHLTNLRPEVWASAKTKAEARASGSVRCP